MYACQVEGALIDKALHTNEAVKGINEVIQMEEAVSLALSTLNLEETLILVTADHSHTLTFNGYPPRGNDIFGMYYMCHIRFDLEVLLLSQPCKAEMILY